MPDDSADEKEKRRKKQDKRMTKILGRLWALDDESSCFQDRPPELQSLDTETNVTSSDTRLVLCLTDVGQKIDSASYRLGRHGWEDFAKDLGGVYNLHTKASRKTKGSSIAKKHLEAVVELLEVIDKSLVKLALDHVPNVSFADLSQKQKNRSSDGNAHGEPDEKYTTKYNKKRKQIEADNNTTSNDNVLDNYHNKKGKQQHSNKNKDLAEREERALDQLSKFVEDLGADRNIVSGYRSRVTKKHSSQPYTNNSQNRYDVVFYNESGRRFRSMLEVGRFLKLVNDGDSNGMSGRGNSNTVRSRRRTFRKPTSKEDENEIKRIRKELEKLRKSHTRVMKSNDDLCSARDESRYPIDDRMLLVEESTKNSTTTSMVAWEASHNATIESYLEKLNIARLSCAGACTRDIDGFPGVPQHCTPDVLMIWDFLCTFERALSLSPIALDDFASALVYVPPDGQTGDDVVVPPVYIAEAHLSLLKLLLQDRTSDDWWWSTLESDENEQLSKEAEFDETDDADKGDVEAKPVIKLDIASALIAIEDPLITTSWMRELERIGRDDNVDRKTVKSTIKAALKFVSNKWVSAYLRKTLDLSKSHGVNFAKRSIVWLYDTVLEARPDLGDQAVHKETVNKAKSKVIEEKTKLMESLPDSVPVITDADVVSDIDFDDESDDESDDEIGTEKPQKFGDGAADTQDEAKKRASSVPPKPLPSLVDLLLPPAKPMHNSDFVDAFTWSHLVGATISRYLHRKKRLLNEIDDHIRDTHVLPPITISERRERENLAASRILTECGDSSDDYSPVEKAIQHLCAGGNYLDLLVVERLAVLRLLIEASYDTIRVYDVVSGNYKQRMNAMKALEGEQRRAKKEAKEKMAADESAAREHLAAEARDKFLDDKREEIRRLNEKSREFTEDVIESLTEEDIIDYDDDIRAEYDSLPTPESFSKSEVIKMIRKIHERAAFDTDALRVLTLNELIEREKVELEEMEGQLSGFGGEEALNDISLDRETLRSIERLQRDIEKAKNQAEKLPIIRERALVQLSDAIQNGTVKVLRTAFTAAKKAKLCGVDDETGGVWAVDLMRDAALELENAKQNKRLLDAQRDLVAKLNKCFIRTEPLGEDRCGNRFWTFDADEVGHTWVEAEFSLKDSNLTSASKPLSGFVELSRLSNDLRVGANDMEDDLTGCVHKDDHESFITFSRLEYHSSGRLPSLVKCSWGCHATEDSLQAVIKQLDSRGIKEKQLKDRLKESLEHVMGLTDKNEIDDIVNTEDDDPMNDHDEPESKDIVKTTGDDVYYTELKMSDESNDDVVQEICENNANTAIGTTVRVRIILEETRTSQTARYENGLITGWKLRKEIVEEKIDDSDDEEFDKKMPIHSTMDVPVWRVTTDRGHIMWIAGSELLQSIARYRKWSNGHAYFEHDAAFFAYRNSHGRFCGKASDAPYSSSPSFFAKLMIKRESELYPKLKVRSYDNSWGGQSGARALWTNSMKDYAYDFPTVRQGLLTLENAFFELTGKFNDYKNMNDDEPIDGTALLNNSSSRLEIELESIEKGLPGLWNSPSSRAVYLAIVTDSSSTGILALALDLLVRNTMKYLQTHKLLNSRSSRTGGMNSTASNSFHDLGANNNGGRPVRSTRRMNAWQQKQMDEDENDDDENYSDEDWQ